MIETHKELVENIKRKVEKVLAMYEAKKAENKALKAKIEKLTLQNDTKDKEIESLKQQYETLKMAKALTTEFGDSEEAKLKVNRIVREIDKCIALLNY